jgi:hypothetical protein
MYILSTILAAIMLVLAIIHATAKPLSASTPLSAVLTARNRFLQRSDTNIKVCIVKTCLEYKLDPHDCEDLEDELEGWFAETLDVGADVNFTTDDDVCATDDGEEEDDISRNREEDEDGEEIVEE